MEAPNFNAAKEIDITGLREALRPPDDGGRMPRYNRYNRIVDQRAKVSRTAWEATK
jgi:hypothetical protein